MADPNYAATLWSGTEDSVRGAAKSSLQYILRNLKLGPADDATVAGNFGAIVYKVKTSSVANQEFSIAHQQSVIPTLVMPVMSPTLVGSQTVPLTVSRAADASRIYFTSPTTGATIFLYCEFGGL